MGSPLPVPPKHEETQSQAAQHVSDAHQVLSLLREKLSRPELDEAIEKLEMALSILSLKTGGML